MQDLPWVVVFVVGMLGACAPEALRLYRLRTQPKRFVWSFKYLALSVPFVFVGGVLAVILPAITPWGAFYTGLSAPVLITSAVKQRGSHSVAAGGGGPQEFGSAQSRWLVAFFEAL